MKTLFAFLLFLTGTTFAQELLPELKTLAEKFASDRNSLVGAPWEKGYTAILQPYSTALNDLEKSATAKGDLQTVGAIQKERESLGDGNPAPAVPPALRSLDGIRSKFIHDLARLNVERAKITNAVDALYLQNLLALSSKFPANAALQKQISDEKKRVLGGNPTPPPTTAAAIPDHPSKNLLNFPIGGEGWDAGGKSATEMEENGVKFTRFPGGQMLFWVNIPAGKTIHLTGKIRALNPMPKRSWGVLGVGYQDENADLKVIVGTGDPAALTHNWQTVNLSAKIPAGVSRLRFRITSEGQFDLRDLMLFEK